MKAYRWAIATIAAAGAAGAAYVFQPDRATVPASGALHDAVPAVHTASSFAQALSELDRAPLSSRMQQDPFMTGLPRPDAAPAPVAAAPTRPAPPAFPYKYAGTLRHVNGTRESFLLRGADLVPIRTGEVLDGTWRIEALTEDRLEVTFVPAGERLSMLLANLVGDAGIPVAQSTITTPVAGYAAPTGVEPLPLAARGGATTSSNIAGGVAVTPAAGPAVAGPRVMANSSTAASPTAAASGATSIALGSQAPVSATPLGSEAPAQGSMPLGAAPTGSFPQGVTPTGKLGL